MQLVGEMVQAGNWLFRWRSYLPFVLLIPLALHLRGFSWPHNSHYLQLRWEALCLAVSVLGLLIRMYTVGHVPAYSSGRNSHRQRALALNTTGIYSLVRHPLYLGNFVMWLGMAMLPGSLDLVAIFALTFWIYYERLMVAEEAFLAQQFGDEYVAWASRTPAIVPRLANWQSPELPFCILTVVRREYTGVFGICLGFFLLDLVINFRVAHRVLWVPFYILLMTCGTLVYVICLVLKRQTRILHVEGR